MSADEAAPAPAGNGGPLVFEQPLNERMRAYLRIDFLYNQALFHAHSRSPWGSRASIASLLDILAIITRSDTRADVLKELERQIAVYTEFQRRPNIAVDRLPLVMDIEADRMRNSTFLNEEFTPEKQVVIEELQGGQDGPWEALSDAVWAAAFTIRSGETARTRARVASTSARSRFSDFPAAVSCSPRVAGIVAVGLGLGRTVVVKLMRPPHDDDPAQVERFLAFGTALIGLTSPHVVPVLRAGRHGPDRKSTRLNSSHRT